jgi:hypothetical protein
LADVLAGRAEDLAIHVDEASVATMPELPPDRSGDSVPPRVLDPLV